MKIKNKLYLSICIIIGLVLIIFFTELILSNKLTKVNRTHELMHHIHKDLSELDIITYEYLLHNEKRMKMQWNLKYNSLKELIGAEISEGEMKSIHSDLEILGSLFSQLVVNHDKIQQLIQNNAPQKRIALNQMLDERLITELLIKSHSITSTSSLKSEKAHLKAMKLHRIISNTTLLLLAFLAIITSTIMLIIIRSITKPLIELTKGAEIIGRGNLAYKVEGKSKDELGNLATAFNKMTTDLMEITASRDDLNYEITTRKQAEEELKKHRENLEELVKKRTSEIEEKTTKLEKTQQSLALLLKDVNESRDKLDSSNKELKEKTKVLEKSQKSLALLLEDVNESRTELDISNKKLKVSNKELEAFSYSVSHDLRAPLRHIDGFTKLFYKSIKHKIDERSQNYFDNIINSSKQMSQLIDDLLIFSKMSRKDIKKTKINMKMIINETRQTFEFEIKENNISLIVDAMPEVKLDAAMIRQVWENLISNAVKFTGNKEHPKIHIGTDKDAEGNTVFFIKDNGIGFDQKYVDKIFGVFQRLHNTNKFPGIGIGLANVKRIILKHGGEIRAEGKVNEGASFFFTLPDV